MRQRLFTISEATKTKQLLAADPGHSSWVSANAGSGKTKVLVDRVLRLLLQGVPPSRILCLTYTKATAAHMSNKILGELARWATLDDDPLRAVLAQLVRDPEKPDAVQMPTGRILQARQLFAQALETPGGLKIETIHAFCTRVLQMAPFEANVPARFEVLEEAQRAALLDQSREQVLADALQRNDTLLGRALERLSRDVGSDDSFAKLLTQALKSRALFHGDDGRPHASGQLRKHLARALDIAAESNVEEIARAFLQTAGRLVDIDKAIAVFDAGSADDLRAASGLRAVKAAAGPREALDAWLDYLTVEDRSKIRKKFGTKTTIGMAPELMEQLGLLADKALAASEGLKAIDTLERTIALADLATAVFARYDAAKIKARALDFDDLVTHTRSLLQRIGSSWVLYKLDSGIDHVLLDEAQDTTPEQWDILRALTDEFTAGLGAHNQGASRTIFAVGDQKQSIYGFQGAAPEQFDAMRRQFRQRSELSEQKFHDIELSTSFRSVPDIVAAVDAVFTPRGHWAGLTFEKDLRPQLHDSACQHETGAVDLWPVTADDPKSELDAWSMPLARTRRLSGAMHLARRIASVIRLWSEAGCDDLGRPFTPGDVLILSRNRGALFESIVKALKDAKVPVAGRDRLTLSVHPAVEDLIVLGRAILQPEDDLALATLLKTPLFDLDDDDLLAFAAERAGSLYQALTDAAPTNPKCEAALRSFERFRRLGAACGPFAFFAQVLGPADGRFRAIHRIGTEAGDAADAFLSAALAFERRKGPSLTAFLEEISRSEEDVKRDLSGAGSEVRVMTIHGAKGLESRIVILADIGPVPDGGDVEALVTLAADPANGPREIPLWSPSKATDTPLIARLKSEKLARLREEHNRLLYVALTRAEERLIICGSHPKGDIPEGCWYRTVEAGLSASSVGLQDCPAPDGQGQVRRYQLSRAVPGGVPASKPAGSAVAVPEWLYRAAPAEAALLPPLLPSSAIAAADRQGRPLDQQTFMAAAAKGKFAHLLLQILPGIPRFRRQAAAEQLGAARAGGLSGEQRRLMIGQSLALLSEPRLETLFGSKALAEVPVAGTIRLPDGRTPFVSGQIDRLVVSDHEVTIADFKTGAAPPANPDAIAPRALVQIAIYRELIAQIFPGRAIRTILIYTANLSVHEPLPGQLESALAQVGHSSVTRS